MFGQKTLRGYMARIAAVEADLRLRAMSVRRRVAGLRPLRTQFAWRAHGRED